MRFFHASDIHLGRAGGHPQRKHDLARAFSSLLRIAVQERVPVVVLAGDLFDSTHPDPETVLAAERALTVAKEGGVRVLAVEGNHDRAATPEQLSWVAYLAHEGLLTLLSPKFEVEPGGHATVAVVRPVDEATHTGAFVELGGVRFVGLSYQGALLDERLQATARALPPSDRPTVFVLHADPEWTRGGEGTTLSLEARDLLREKVGYLALGHRHRQRMLDGWIYNPGSLEATHLGAPVKRGFWDVTVSTSSGRFEASYRASEQRRIEYLAVDCTAASDEAALLVAAKKAIDRRLSRSLMLPSLPDEDLERPVVCLSLEGKTAFASRLLDERALEDRLRAHPTLRLARPLVVLLTNRTLPPGMVYVEGGELDDEDALQRQIRAALAEVARAVPVADVAPEALAELALELKRVTEDESGDDERSAQARRALKAALQAVYS